MSAYQCCHMVETSTNTSSSRTISHHTSSHNDSISSPSTVVSSTSQNKRGTYPSLHLEMCRDQYHVQLSSLSRKRSWSERDRACSMFGT